MKKQLLAAAIAAAAFGSAQAAAPAYPPLSSGSFLGTVQAESGPWGTANLWSFWSFEVPFFGEATITVTPNESEIDIVMAVWYGLESDVSIYFDMSTGSLNSVFVGSADDNLNGVGESLSFLNEYGSERFVLAIADYKDEMGFGQLGYTITAAVPEPETYAMLLAGLGLIGVAARRRAA